MAEKVGEIAYDVRLELSKLDADINEVRQRLSGVEKSMSKASSSTTKAGAAIATSMIAVNGAISLVSNSIGAAVKRVDTLNNAERTFTAMGFSAENSAEAMSRLKRDIEGLPTALDEAVRGMSQLVAVSGDLVVGEQGYKAINDGVLAFNGSVEDTQSAIQQLSQDFGRGMVQAQTFNSLMGTMAPVLNAVAQQMGITVAELKDMGSKGEMSAEMLLQKLIALDHEGGGGLASLESMAQGSTKGVETSFANMQTAITRAMADFVNAVGTSNIAAFLDGIGSAASSLISGMRQLANQASQLAAGFGLTGEAASNVTQVLGSGVTTFALVASGIFLVQKAFIAARVAMIAFTSHPIIAVLSLVAAGAVMVANAFELFGSSTGGAESEASALQSQLDGVNAQISLLENNSTKSSSGMSKAAKSANNLAKQLKKVEEQASKVWKDYYESLNDIRIAHEETIQDLTKQIADETANYNAEVEKRRAAFAKTEADEIKAHQEKVTALTNQISFLQKRNNAYNAERLAQLQFALDKEQALYTEQQTARKEEYDADIAAEKLARDQKLRDLQTQLNSELAFQNKHRADLASVQGMIKADEIESLKSRRDEQLRNLEQQKQDALTSNAETNSGLLANNAETLEKLKKQRDELNKKIEQANQGSLDKQKMQQDDFWTKIIIGAGDIFNFGGGEFWRPMRESFTRMKDWLGQLGRTIWDVAIGIGKGMINGLLGAIERILNTPIDLLNGALGTINKLPGVNIPRLNRMQIPRLASGGVLTTATPFLGGEYAGARINPEIVTPQNIMAETFEKVLDKKGGGQQMNVTINVSGTFATSASERRKVAEDIVEALNQAQRARFA